MQKLLTFFFSRVISVYAVFNDQSFNDTLTNDIVSLEQMDPWYYQFISLSFWYDRLILDVTKGNTASLLLWQL